MSAIINKRHTKYQGRVFTLETENITLENGITTNIDLIRHPGASAMVPFKDNNTVILLKQYRHAVGKIIWEIPAGTLEPGEAPIHCAKRELIEEIGYSAGNFHALGEITPVPGYSDERIHLFLATDLSPAMQRLDHDELLEVEEVPFSDAMKMIYNNTIQDAKTIAGLLLAVNVLH